MSTEQQAPELDPKYDSFDYPTISFVSDESDKTKGYPGYVSEQQKAQVFQLRSLLEAEGYTQRLDTLTLLRFLRARKFDIKAAKQMFVEFEEWRTKTLLDDLVPIWTYPERAEMFKYYPQYYHKTDKDGRPVYVEKLGGIDLTEMRKITTDERMLDNLAVEYEKCAHHRFPACSRESGHLVETCCSIMDLKGASITRAGQVYNYVQRASVISQNYYPERLGKLYIINAPWGFSTVWSVVKGWLDPVTVKKINLLGGNYQKELLAQIPAANLPKEYGGECACEGEAGCQGSDAGPWNKETAWFQTEEAQNKAREALKGTSKDPAQFEKGAEDAGAQGQETATAAA